MKKRTRNRFCPSAISLAVAAVLGSASMGAMAYPCTGGNFSVTQTGPSTIPDAVCINIATTNSKGLDAFGGNITDNGQLTITLTGAGGTYGVSTDNGHNIDLQDTQISTSGNASFGIYSANNNSIVTSNNILTIRTLGTNSWAVWADNNAKVILHTTDIATTGTNSYGLYASAGGNVKGVAAIKVDTSSGSGAKTYGLFATGLNSVIDSTGGVAGSMLPNNVIITGGNSSDGLRAEAGGVINITGPNSNNAGVYTTTINTSASGNSTVGAHATGANSQILVKGRTSIITGGDNSFGVQADSAGGVSFTDYVNIDTVSAIGDQTYGVYASGGGSSVKFANNIDIATGGTLSYGIYADSSGVVQNDGGVTNINSNGTLAGKIGLYASGVDSLIDLGTTNIVTRGATSSGIRTDLSATVNIHGALSVDTAGTGAGTFGLHSKDLGSSINIDGPAGQQNNILTGGDNSYGVYADNGGTIVFGLGGGTLIDTTSSGDNTVGVYASNIDSVSNAVGNAGNIAFVGSGALTIQTAGLNSYGLFAEAGSSISNTGSTIINSIGTSNAGKVGIYASGAGSSITLADASVTTRGNGASGVRADNGGAVTIVGNTQIDTSGLGNNTFGLHSKGLGSSINIDGAAGKQNNILSGGNNSYGVYAENGGTIVFGLGGNTLIDTTSSGDNTIGVYASNIDSASNAVGNAGNIAFTGGGTLTIQTAGLNSYGLFAEAGSSISNTGSTIINSIGTSNAGKIGIYASGAGSSITLADASVTTRGYGASGVRADNGGTVNIKGNVQIDTSGSGSNTFGIHSTGIGSVVMLNDGNITTDGANSHGLVVDNGGAIVVNGSLNVLTVGDNSAGVLVDDSATGFSRISIASSGSTNTITTYGANSYGIAFINNTINVPVAHLDNITINTYGAGADALYIDPDQLLINNVLAGDNFTAQQGNVITLIGGNRNIITDSSHLTSVNGLGVSAQSNTNLSLSLTNNSSLRGAIVQDGTSVVNLSVDPSSSWSFAQNSLLQSVNNSGTISLTTINTSATVLGDYNSSNGLLDINSKLGADSSPTAKLIVQGSTSGTGRVAVTNVNGAGAKTANGIEVISVAGASNAKFTLKGRAVAGAYEYELFQGTPTLKDGNWYLRALKTLRPEDGSYLANQSAANGMFIQTLHERLGETMYESDLCGCKNLNGSAWARVSGYDQKSEAGNGKLNNRTQSSFVQVGSDLIKWKSNQSRLQAGIMFSAGQANTNSRAENNSARAEGKLNGNAIGIYGTWYGAGNQRNEGPYVDSWLQYGRYSNSVKGDFLAEQSYDSHNWLGSVEAGYAIALTKNEQNKWYVEPQAQLIYSNYTQDHIQEANGSKVEAKDSNGWSSRLGARVYAREHLANGMKLKPFMEVNWLHSSKAAGEYLNDVEISSDLPSEIAEVKLGVEAALSRHVNLWGQVGYQTGSKGYQQTSGNIGVKYIW